MDHRLSAIQTSSLYKWTSHKYSHIQYTHNLSHELHSLTPTVSQSTFAECTQQIVSMCVFFFFFLSAEHPHYRMPQRWADSGIHLHIPYLYSSSSWFNFSFLLLFSFLLSYHCVAIYPHIIKFLILLALLHMHAHIHKLSHILQCKWNMCTYKSTSGYAWGIEGVFLVVYIKSSILVLL